MKEPIISISLIAAGIVFLITFTATLFSISNAEMDWQNIRLAEEHHVLLNREDFRSEDVWKTYQARRKIDAQAWGVKP
jgi:hypothetical protein